MEVESVSKRTRSRTKDVLLAVQHKKKTKGTPKHEKNHTFSNEFSKFLKKGKNLENLKVMIKRRRSSNFYW